ncbi:MAG: hypothetical protein V7637_5138 [Mycobacteriales bacterium]
MRSSTVLAGLTALAAGLVIASGAGSAAAAPAAPAACAGTVQITSFGFASPTAMPGQIATATLTAQNCTNQPQSTSTTWTGRFVGTGTGIPAGCPAIDPLARPATFPANGTVTASGGYLIFAGCTATDLQVSVRITAADGTLLAQQTANVTIGASQPTCSVAYVRENEWRGGFVADVVLTNIGATPINGWTLAFDFPGDQRIGNGWNATVTQNGTTVTATNASYDGTIAPGGQVWVGLYGTWQTSDASPTGGFTLNGAACATG